MPRRWLRLDVLRGAVRLAGDTVAGVTGIVEAMHAGIAIGPGRPGRARGIAGGVYRSVRAITRIAGSGTEAVLAALSPAFAPRGRDGPHTGREAVLAALNGGCGDHLAATANPLAIEMAFRRAGRRLRLDRPALAADLGDASPSTIRVTQMASVEPGWFQVACHSTFLLGPLQRVM